MSRFILIVILVGAGFGAGVLWMNHRDAPARPGSEQAVPAEAAAAKESGPAQLSRDTNGNAVIAIEPKVWKGLGLQLKSLTALQLSPEVKGYGRVLDPAPLAVLLTDQAAAQAAYVASSNDLARLELLEGQGNASARALQTAEAATQRDQAAMQACRERIVLSWGKAIAERPDLQALVRSLVAMDAALVRIDLRVGDTLSEPPTSARIVAPSGKSAEAEFVEEAPAVDPLTLGPGFIFLLKGDGHWGRPGETVTGYLRLPGKKLEGVLVPQEAVVRTEGVGWVYVANATGSAFVRTEVPLDRSVDGGWFVTADLHAGDKVVVNGAQQLLSFEQRGAGGEE